MKTIKTRFLFAFLAAAFFCGCGQEGNSQEKKDDFVSIFDGETLKGWEGDSLYWRVDSGNIVGEISAGRPLAHNSFLIWRDGETEDFELKLLYRISEEGNSGINYRSEVLSQPAFAMKGYQADIDGKNTYTGLNYEERARGFLAKRGEKMMKETGKEPVLLQELGSDASLLSLIKTNDWNEYHLIVSGNRFQHFINGVLMSEFIDEDTENRKFSGNLGLQIHTGPPMKVEFRNIRIKHLKK